MSGHCRGELDYDWYSFYTSGTTSVKQQKPEYNCVNCGSNQIVSNECQHCGTWYGYGQKPKPVKHIPQTPWYYSPPEPKPQSFLQRIFRRKT